MPHLRASDLPRSSPIIFVASLASVTTCGPCGAPVLGHHYFCRRITLLLSVLWCVARVGRPIWGTIIFASFARRIHPNCPCEWFGPRWPALKTPIIFVARVTFHHSPEEFGRIVRVARVARVARVNLGYPLHPYVHTSIFETNFGQKTR